jgi:type IV pilus assembly protein PilC
MKRIIGELASDIRTGSSLSIALGRHPQVFSTMYHRTIAAGEQGGNLEVVLRQLADFIERGVVTGQKVKRALTYPVIAIVVAIGVIALLTIDIPFLPFRAPLPTFTDLFSTFGAESPLLTRMLIGLSGWFSNNGPWLVLGLIIVAVIGYIYVRSPDGRYQFDRLMLRLPVIGRINLLSELGRCCRTMALLFKVGLPLPEIMSLATHSSNNRVVVEALTEVRQDMIRGEGLSRPMARRELFLPLMVQMVGVGEETGNLDNTLTTVAESFETEADDRTNTAVGLIQPVMTIIIGIIVAFVALALIMAMYSIYGEVTF